MYGHLQHTIRQQLNFAVWCAIRAAVLHSLITLLMKIFRHRLDHSADFMFIIQLAHYMKWPALPDSTVFNALNNPYSVEKYHELCKEFGIPANSDFRFTDGPNNGLGYTWTTGAGDRNTVYNGHDFFLKNDEYFKMGIHKIKGPLI